MDMVAKEAQRNGLNCRPTLAYQVEKDRACQIYLNRTTERNVCLFARMEHVVPIRPPARGRAIVIASSTFRQRFVNGSSTFRQRFVNGSSTFRQRFVNVSSTFRQRFVNVSSTVRQRQT